MVFWSCPGHGTSFCFLKFCAPFRFSSWYPGHTTDIQNSGSKFFFEGIIFWETMRHSVLRKIWKYPGNGQHKWAFFSANLGFIWYHLRVRSHNSLIIIDAKRCGADGLGISRCWPGVLIATSAQNQNISTFSRQYNVLVWFRMITNATGSPERMKADTSPAILMLASWRWYNIPSYPFVFD
jgi:hypothetical protein